MKNLTKTGVAAGILCLMVGLMHVSMQAQPPAGKGGPGGKGKGGFGQDARAQSRTYHFEDTKEEMQYSLFVSSKVKKDQKAPLIVTLHGLASGPTVMMGTAAVDLAEKGGYILVAPMGYNNSGWYGSMGTGAGMTFGDKGKGGGGNQPENLGELSEKDVMNVIAMVRKEFNVDDKRMYLMGHSMGGAGALFLGSKHASLWAGVGAEAPAAFSMNNNRAEVLQKLKDAKVPVILVSGDMDEMVPVTNTRMWVDTMKELKMEHEYVEQPGITHGPVINTGLPPIYEFFTKHKR